MKTDNHTKLAIVAAVLVGLFAVVAVNKYISNRTTVAPAPTASILVAKMEILEGSEIGEEMIDSAEIPFDSLSNMHIALPPKGDPSYGKAFSDVVVGYPLMINLVERGEGAALLVFTVAETSDVATALAIADGARRSGWTDTRPAGARQMPDAFPPHYSRQNLSLDFKITPREDGAGCNVSYRFTDDEVLVPNQRSNQ